MDVRKDQKRSRPNDTSDILRDTSISPPPKRCALPFANSVQERETQVSAPEPEKMPSNLASATRDGQSHKIIPSPMQLNFVQELSASSNIDTVSLGKILGDPMIKECWLFNYLFDVDFVMKHFDPDTRDITKVKIVHGSWKNEDSNRIAIEDAARRYSNVQVLRAYMPEMFGTHHSKMIVIFRHDDLAQVIILTANFIDRDWRMSQAIWRTPLLPMQPQDSSPASSLPPLGNGSRFKHDLLAYFRGYGRNLLQHLITQLLQYDFSEVRGALIASVPGKQTLQSLDPEVESMWGWPGLKRILGCIPSKFNKSSAPDHQPHIVAQVSSVAAVGEKWLNTTLIPALSSSSDPRVLQNQGKKPKISIIFPTAEEIRRSIDGYGSGASIHMKTSSNQAQVKQLAALRPMLCHWAGDQASPSPSVLRPQVVREAGRRRAAPHIKTYVRFSDSSMEQIGWAMVTSANISTQAWGAAASAGGEVRVCSYEIGVVLWPALWGDKAEMVPVFRTDTPPKTDKGSAENTVVGWRMPYDLPLVSYKDDEMPWCATEACSEPDWMGGVWPGYGT